METSPEINELAAALSAFQGTVTTVEKTSTVKAGSYSYKYAPLDVILDAVRKPLRASGLAVTQLLVDNGIMTMLTHSSGQYIRSTTAVLPGKDVKALGGNITYMRRYALSAILGLATSEDVDGDTDELVSVKYSNGKAADKPPTVINEQPDYLAAAVASVAPANFFQNIVAARIGYDNVNHVSAAIKKELGDDVKFPAKDKRKRQEWVDLLKYRKETPPEKETT